MTEQPENGVSRRALATLALAGAVAAGMEGRAIGQGAAMPFNGSRIMPLANEEAARLGLPGRTEMVGNLKARPSIYPLRE